MCSGKKARTLTLKVVNKTVTNTLHGTNFTVGTDLFCYELTWVSYYNEVPVFIYPCFKTDRSDRSVGGIFFDIPPPVLGMLVGSLVPRLSITRGRKIEPGIQMYVHALDTAAFIPSHSSANDIFTEDDLLTGYGIQ